MTTNVNASSLTWQNYVDLDNDVKPWLQIPPTDITVDYRLQLLTDMTCQWAQGKLGQPVAPTQFDRRFNGWSGWNGAYIELPYYPVLEVTSVIEYWGGSGPHVLSEGTPTNQVDGYQMDYQRGQLIRVFPGLVQKPWFPGSRNIEVVWTAGRNPIPADLKVATLEMIAHWWRNTQQMAAIRSGPSPDYDPEQIASGLWQGTPLRITALLDGYQQVGIG
jgi:hypothetical protein